MQVFGPFEDSEFIGVFLLDVDQTKHPDSPTLDEYLNTKTKHTQYTTYILKLKVL